MRFSLSTATTAVLACASVANAASWSFTDASVIIKTKGSAVDGASREKYGSWQGVIDCSHANFLRFNPTSPLSSAVTLGPADTLSVSLTVTEDDNGKRPHQAFLTLQEPATGLEESYVVAVKESGKGKVEVVCQ
jgi:oligosaccharyltransferase complex subunit delta (ribophorin II)